MRQIYKHICAKPSSVHALTGYTIHWKFKKISFAARFTHPVRWCFDPVVFLRPFGNKEYHLHMRDLTQNSEKSFPHRLYCRRRELQKLTAIETTSRNRNLLLLKNPSHPPRPIPLFIFNLANVQHKFHYTEYRVFIFNILFRSYADIGIHEEMLSDTIRTNAYRWVSKHFFSLPYENELEVIPS